MKQEMRTEMMGAFLALYPEMLGNEDREAVDKAYSDFIDDVMELGLHEMVGRIMFLKEHSGEAKE